MIAKTRFYFKKMNSLTSKNEKYYENLDFFPNYDVFL